MTSLGFPHGTFSGYTRGCGCDGCCDANASYAARRKRLIASGVRLVVPADRAVQHLDALVAAGRTMPEIAHALGHKKGDWLTYLRRTPGRKIKRATEQRILALTVDGIPAEKVPAEELIANVRALASLGYSQTWQARQIGLSGPTFRVEDGRFPRRGRYERHLALVLRVDGRVADPARDGIPQWMIDRTIREAEQRGWSAAGGGRNSPA